MNQQAWEKGFERTWEGIEEDEHGNIQTTAEADLRLSRQRRAATGAGGAVRRGMIRYLYVAIDLSAAMQEQDMRPGRLQCTLRIVTEFINRFFDQNPLSQLGILVIRDGRAERITELSGSPKAHIDALKAAADTHGAASLQNVLEQALASLSAVPEYGSREVLVLYASLSTCDPGDIHGTASRLKAKNVRVSIVGLGAEMFICRKISEETGGDYSVAVDERHYEDAVLAQTTPPPTLAKKGPAFAEMVQMGFPKRQDNQAAIGYSGKEQVLTMYGYLCPRCNSKTIELPSTCVVCQLPLVSAPHLARSYHHLFPVPRFKEIASADTSAAASAGGGDAANGGAAADTAAAAAAMANGDINNNKSLGGRVSPNDSLMDGETAAGAELSNVALGGIGSSGGDGALGEGKEGEFCAGCLRDMRGAGCRYECPDCKSSFCIECDIFIHDSLHNCPGCCS